MSGPREYTFEELFEPRPHDPPFDGGAACPACPMEVRDLIATLHNYLGALDRGDYPRAVRKLVDLRESFTRMEAISKAHFSNPSHWQPHGAAWERNTA